MKIYVLIATIDEGICKVPAVLLPEEAGVRYVVSWQQTEAETSMNGRMQEAMSEAEAKLRARHDIIVTTLKGRGLCRNRNHSIATALDDLDNPLEDAIFVIADDDEQIMPEAFERLRTTYGRYPKMDGALMRLRSSVNGQYFKSYPEKLVAYGQHPKSYYVCSWEMTFRARVWQTGIHFDERFGLGAEQLCAGEEEVLLTDMLRKGLRVLIVPEDIGYTDPVTTGDKVLDAKVLRSKGAVYGYQLSYVRALLRGLREALSLGMKKHRNPLPLFREIMGGIKYIRS